MDFWVLDLDGVPVVVDAWHQSDASADLVDQVAQARESITFVTGSRGQPFSRRQNPTPPEVDLLIAGGRAPTHPQPDADRWHRRRALGLGAYAIMQLEGGKRPSGFTGDPTMTAAPSRVVRIRLPARGAGGRTIEPAVTGSSRASTERELRSTQT